MGAQRNGDSNEAYSKRGKEAESRDSNLILSGNAWKVLTKDYLD